MSNAGTPENDPGEPVVYQIRIKGHLGPHWSDWFAGLSITALDNDDTLLTGLVVDQAALYGVLEISAGRRTALSLGQSCSTRSGSGKNPSSRK